MTTRIDRLDVIATLLSFALLLVSFLGGWLDPVELAVRDALMRLRAPGLPAEHVVAVLVDERALAETGRWPWSHGDLARLLESALRAQPRAVVVDILLSDSNDGTAKFHDVIAGHDVILAAAPLNGDQWLTPPAALRDGATLAHAVLEVDRDGVLRRYATTKQLGETALPAIAELAASRISGLPVRVARRVTTAFRTAPSDVPRISASEVLAGRASELLRGRVVFIGASAAGLGDRVVTPVSAQGSPEPGVLIHAAVTEDRIHRREVLEVSPLATALIGGVLVFIALRLRRLGGRRRLVAEAMLLLVPVAVASAALVVLDVALPVVTFVIASATCVISVEASTAAAVHAAAGRAARTMGAGPETESTSPESRVQKLEQLATNLREKEQLDAEARRVLVHELKTPLTSIRGMSQLLAEFDLDEAEQKEFTGMVREESDRLATMIERLLDLERLSLRSFDENATSVDLGRLTTERIKLAVAGSGRVIEATVSPGVVRGDHLLLGRVFDNLLTNALKFSPDDSPVRVRVASAGDQVTIEIEDEGPGVEESEREQVFKRFARGSAAHGKTGLGLGLALVAEVVAWHKGDVSVHGGSTGGAMFRIVLPASTLMKEAV
jgi:signal transduction histidine kinase